MVFDSEVFSNYSPWIRFDDLNWMELNFNTYLKSFPKNVILYHQQEYSRYVYIIKEGRVRLSIYSEDGSEKCLTIAEKGCMFGELSILDNLPNFTTATTIVECEIFLIPKTNFKHILMHNAEISQRVLQSLVRKIRTLSAQIEDLTFKNSYSRIASHLIKLAYVHGSSSTGIYKLNIKFTHQEMANLTGLSRVTVSNIMGDLLERGILSKSNGYIVINDINKLYELI